MGMRQGGAAQAPDSGSGDGPQDDLLLSQKGLAAADGLKKQGYTLDAALDHITDRRADQSRSLLDAIARMSMQPAYSLLDRADHDSR